VRRFANPLLYWIFSLPTHDPAYPGTFFDYVATGKLVINVTITGRDVTASFVFDQ
jgi:hypothetical protein